MKYERFNQGEIVRLDADFNNSSLVEIVSQTPHQMFTVVKSEDDYWEVMTDRLSRI